MQSSGIFLKQKYLSGIMQVCNMETVKDRCKEKVWKNLSSLLKYEVHIHTDTHTHRYP